MTGKKNVEAVYSLSPMQQGMLFHSLESPDSGVYVEQLTCVLRGELDVAAFEGAWEHVFRRHAVLRTAFVWRKLERAYQVVLRTVELPFRFEDWSGSEPAGRGQRFEEMLRADHARGFELSKAPLSRLTLVRLAEEEFRFIWTHHHLLLDGWSLPLLIEEVRTAYERLRAGEAGTLAPEQPYRAYIEWLKGQDAAQAEAFWRRTLSGFRAPTLMARSHGGGGGAHGECAGSLGEEVTARLQAFARQNQVTLNTVLQAAWALLVGAYSGEPDVVFGATVSGRPAELAGSERMVGLFINTLPVRMRIEPEKTVSEWLQSIQAAQAEMRQFESSSLVDVQSSSEVPRGTPLFDSLVVFENYPVDAAMRAPGSGFQIAEVRASEKTNYPLTLVSGPGKQMGLRLLFDPARVSATAAERIVAQLAGVLEALPACEGALLGSLPLTTPHEDGRIRQEWNEPVARTPVPSSIPELFEAQAARRPDAPAVTFEGRSLSYGELNAQANRLARRLVACGVGPEKPVALYLERSAEIVAAVLGTLKAGAAYVPLDPVYPAARLEMILDDCQAGILVTTHALASALPRGRAKLLYLDDDSLASESAANLGVRIEPENAAYVIYTSGSTGKPKGVVVTHANVTRLMAATNEWYGFTENDVWTLFHSYAFDFSVWELWGALLYGGRLVVVPYLASRAPQEFYRLLVSESVTVLNQTPSAFMQLIQAEEACGVDPGLKLRLVIFGGEALDIGALRPWFERHPEVPRLVNMYGITETTVHCTYRPLSPADVDGVPGSMIGVRIPDLRIYIVDALGRLAPIGVPGEIWVGGDGVARGYLHRPDLTADGFVPDPFSGEPGARLYRSGDCARYLDNGDIEYIGRLDFQVKLRGFRIELGEIEAVLRERVAQAVVVLRGERLVAYVVGETAGLREHLAGRLPDYMVPAAFVQLEQLPLTPNGKVDRRALPAAEENALALGSYSGPRTPAEEMLVEIWQQVLRAKRVGIHDNFFELGGHSLLATQLLARVETVFGVEVGVRALFEHPTVAGLAAVIEGARGIQAPPITRAEHPPSGLPLSFAQQRLWFLDQLEPNSPFYNNPVAVRLKGQLDIARLEEALNALIQRHEALRTRFVAVDGKPVAVVDAELRLKLAVEPAVDVEQQARAEALEPFDLAAGPLIRARLLRVNAAEHIALVTLHHIISDGWSTGVLVRELSALYAGRELAPLGIQYGDFAAWQRAWLSGEVLEAQLDYWREQLQGAPPVLELATDRARPAVQSFRGSHYRFQIPAEVAGELAELSRREGVTLFMVLLAAYQVLLSRYAGGQEDVVVGTPIANRQRTEVEALIGFFVNTLVLRTKLAGEPSVRELLGRVRETCLGAYAHQDLPFETLVETLQPERKLSHAPLFQTMLVWANAPAERLELGGLAGRGGRGRKRDGAVRPDAGDGRRRGRGTVGIARVRLGPVG